MILKEKGDLQWLQFENLMAHHELIHGFTTKNGGVSNPPFSSLNMGLSTRDDPQSIKENYKIILTALGVEDRARYMTKQVHSDQIFVVTDPATIKENFVPDYDGLLTNRDDVVLMTYYADCVPLFFYDPVKRAGGVVHSGWKGTAKQIGKRMVERMVAVYGSNPRDIRAGIGPSAGICCYEIGPDVIASFSWLQTLKCYIRPTRENHYKIDLKGINKYILEDAGLLPENIEVSSLCSMCTPELLYSYRRQRPYNGLMSAIFALKGNA